LNNVEQYLDNTPATGKYNIVVRGKSIPKGPQTYSIVISGDIVKDRLCIPYTALSLTPEVTSVVTISYGFGMISFLLVPCLALVALYYYYQFTVITTRSDGYKNTYLSVGDKAETLTDKSKKTTHYMEMDDVETKKKENIINH
jgi:hypothetical protein